MLNQLTTDLRAARQLIEEKENWYGGDNKDTWSDDQACAMQACARSTEDRDRTYACVAGLYAGLIDMQGFPCQGLANFNDTHTHAEVLDLFDRAIQAAEQETVIATGPVQV